MGVNQSFKEDYESSRGIGRVKKTRWWLIILIIIGLLATLYTIIKQTRIVTSSQNQTQVVENHAQFATLTDLASRSKFSR